MPESVFTRFSVTSCTVQNGEFWRGGGGGGVDLTVLQTQSEIGKTLLIHVLPEAEWLFQTLNNSDPEVKRKKKTRVKMKVMI